MAYFTNTGEGARGIVTKAGLTIWAEPGETIEVADADKVHADFEKSAKAPKAEGEPTGE